MTIVGLEQIARQLAVATQPQSVAPTLTRRQGVVSAVNAGPPVSVDVTVGGVIIPAVRYLASYSPVAADVVWVDFNGADPLVIGTTGGDTGWIALSTLGYQNSWVDYSAAYLPQYRRRNGLVMLRGLVKSGVIGQPIVTMPTGFRPVMAGLTEIIFAAVSNDLLGELRVTAAGNVTPTVGSNLWFNLTGVTYWVD